MLRQTVSAIPLIIVKGRFEQGIVEYHQICPVSAMAALFVK
jgi:hypothetical protein